MASGARLRLPQRWASSHLQPGFVLDLDSTNRTAYLETLAQLKDNRWIDRQTRAILISLNTYNGNFDFICVSTFILEFSHGGSVVATCTPIGGQNIRPAHSRPARDSRVRASLRGRQPEGAQHGHLDAQARRAGHVPVRLRGRREGERGPEPSAAEGV